jgi:hypothetical protein
MSKTLRKPRGRYAIFAKLPRYVSKCQKTNVDNRFERRASETCASVSLSHDMPRVLCRCKAQFHAHFHKVSDGIGPHLFSDLASVGLYSDLAYT